MRLAAFVLAFFSLLTTAASAAPYILCDLPSLETWISFDVGNQMFQLEKDGWASALVQFGDKTIFGEWNYEGHTIGVTYHYLENRSIFKWDSPTMNGPVFGPASCKFYED